MTLETTNFLLALGTVALQVVSIGLLSLFFFRKTSLVLGEATRFVSSWAFLIAFLSTLTASAMTLFYSDVLGIEPCALCWWQRIFLYPQVVLFGLALFKRERSPFGIDYAIILSLLGAAFALYHHALQTLPSGTLPCPSQGVSCAQRFVFEFGYITFPLMAFSLFMFLIVLMFFARSRNS